MAKRKGSSASRPRARPKVAKGGSEAKGTFEDECDQLEREIIALKGEHAEVEELLRPLIRKEEQLKQSLHKKKRRIEEVKNARRLDKLPLEVWDRILDELESEDLFPLALSCRYFRQKQKELVARTRQGRPESGKPRPALRTTLRLDPEKGQPASADYLWFCINERGSTDVGQEEDYYIWYMAAFHGHLPLLRELLISLETRLDPEFEFFDLLTLDLGENAGEFSICSVSSFYTFSLLTRFSPLRSSRRPTGDVAGAENPAGVRVD